MILNSFLLLRTWAGGQQWRTMAWVLVRPADGGAATAVLGNDGGYDDGLPISIKWLKNPSVANLKNEKKPMIGDRFDRPQAFYCMPSRGAVTRAPPIRVLDGASHRNTKRPKLDLCPMAERKVEPIRRLLQARIPLRWHTGTGGSFTSSSPSI